MPKVLPRRIAIHCSQYNCWTFAWGGPGRLTLQLFAKPYRKFSFDSGYTPLDMCYTLVILNSHSRIILCHLRKIIMLNFPLNMLPKLLPFRIRHPISPMNLSFVLGPTLHSIMMQPNAFPRNILSPRDRRYWFPVFADGVCMGCSLKLMWVYGGTGVFRLYDRLDAVVVAAFTPSSLSS